MPYSLSKNERLLWLEDWIFSSSEGLLYQRVVELMFIKYNDIDESVKFLINNDRWIYLNQNEFYAPNGTIVRFLLDDEAEKILNKYRLKSNDKKRANIYNIREVKN